jgi:hypothetical protein
MAEAARILIDALALETGKGRRALQSMAARGLIPGAAKIGREWTFDRIKVRRWIRDLEGVACRTTYTSATASGGSRCKLPASHIDEAYERALGL